MLLDSAVHRHPRGKLCCCDKEIFVHRFTLAMIICDILILVGITSMYFKLIFSGELYDNFEWMYIKDKLSRGQLDTITHNFALIIVPIYLIHIAKVVTGINMVRQRFARPQFMKYYVVSWSFYWSFLTQMSLILLASWPILKTWVSVLWICVLTGFIPAWVIMNM